MDKIKSEAQLAASQKQKANAIISGKRLDHIEQRVDDIHRTASGLAHNARAILKQGTDSRARAIDAELTLGRIAADVAMLDRRVDSFKTWNMIRDIIIIALLVLLLLCVGYNTTQFWGW